MLEKIKQLISQSMPVEFISIEDDSARHVGHHKTTSGGHYQLLVVSYQFESMGLRERHQLIYQILEEEMKQDIHAIQIKVYTPNEWNAKKSAEKGSIDLRFMLFVFPFLALILSFVFVWIYPQFVTKPLPTIKEAPVFQLVDNTGKIFDSKDLNGKVWILDFIFTRCQMQCPMMSSKMKELQNQFQNAKFVSITVDPTFDTPRILAAYAPKYGAKPNQWYFLTGDKEIINDVAKSFSVSGSDEPVFHSIAFVLVDFAGQIRGYYNAEDSEKMMQLKKDVKWLLSAK